MGMWSNCFKFKHQCTIHSQNLLYSHNLFDLYEIENRDRTQASRHDIMFYFPRMKEAKHHNVHEWIIFRTEFKTSQNYGLGIGISISWFTRVWVIKIQKSKKTFGFLFLHFRVRVKGRVRRFWRWRCQKIYKWKYSTIKRWFCIVCRTYFWIFGSETFESLDQKAHNFQTLASKTHKAKFNQSPIINYAAKQSSETKCCATPFLCWTRWSVSQGEFQVWRDGHYCFVLRLDSRILDLLIHY